MLISSQLLVYIPITLSLGLKFLVKGVTTRGQLGLVEIIHQYIRYDEIHEAINVLNTMNWNTMGRQCYICLSAIVNHLLKQKLTPDREGKGPTVFVTYFCGVFVSHTWIMIDCIKKTIDSESPGSQPDHGIP